MQRKKRILAVLIGLTALFTLAVGVFTPSQTVMAGNLIMSGSGNVEAETGKELWNYTFDGNNLTITYSYFHSSTALLSYETVGSFWTMEDTDGNPKSSSGSHKEFVIPSEPAITKDDESSDTTTKTTITYSAGTILSMLRELHGDDLKPNTPYEVYVSEVYQLKKRSSTSASWQTYGSKYYSLDGIRNAAEWSEETYENFQYYYDIPMTFYLAGGNLFVVYVDMDTGEQLGIKNEGTVLAGESKSVAVSTSYSANGKTYSYANKYQCTYLDEPDSGAWQSASGAMISIKPTGDGDVTLFVGYKDTSVTPIPTPMPTVTPPVTPPVPVTPTPTVTPTDTPTPVPTSASVYAGYERHFTTGNGYNVTDSIHSTTDKLASDTASSASTIEDVFGQYMTKSYSLGTDSDGNEWYFIADATGGTATYVHPYKYNGSTDITSFTELVFPSSLTLYGKTYTVKSIGGAGNKYGNGSSGSSSSTAYEYGIVIGSYSKSTYTSGSITRSRDYYREYALGVVGNGEITSWGSYLDIYSSTGSVVDKYFFNDYYYANTTLKKVSIPSSVTEICDYAFYQCQALTEITGGTGVTKIGNYAFYTGTNNYYLSDKQGSNYSYYYYNGSYSLTAATDTMKKWATQMVLPASLTLPAFAKLETIGNSAFYYRYNLGDVTFKESVTSIGSLAFAKARLNSVTFLNDETKITSGYETLSANQTVIHTNPYSTAFEYWMTNPAYYRIKAGYTLSYDANGGSGTMEAEVSEVQIEYAQVKESIRAEWTYSSSSRQVYFVLDKEGTLWTRSYSGGKWTELASGTKFTKIAGANSNGGTGFLFYALDENGNLWSSICSNKVGEFTQITSDTAYTTVSCAEDVMVCLDTNGKAYYMGRFYLDAYVRNNSLITYSVSSANTLTALGNTTAFTEIEIGQRKVSFSVSDDSIDKTFTCFIALDKSGNIWGYGPSPNGEYGTTRKVTMKAYSERTGSNNDWTDAANSWKQVTSGIRYIKFVGSRPTYSMPKGYSMALDSNGCLWHTHISTDTWVKDQEAALIGTGKYTELYRDGTASRVYGKVKDTNGTWWQGKLASNTDEYLTFTEIENPESGYSYFNAFYLSFVGTAKENAFTKSGYKFVGWNTKADGTGTSYAVGDTFEMTGDVTLYAKWELIARIVYHANGGTGTMADTLPTSSSTTSDSTTLTVAANGYTKQGHTFTGWNTEPNGTGNAYAPGKQIAVTGILNLYAQWKPHTYTVSYYGNGSTEGAMSKSTHIYGISKRLTKNTYNRIYTVAYDYTVTSGSTKASLLEELTVKNTRAVGTFLGWSKSAAGEVVYADEERVLNLTTTNGANISLYAKWKLGTVTIPDVERAGYKFLGWDTKKDGSGTRYQAGNTLTPTANMTLYAQWTAKQYTVTLENGGADLVAGTGTVTATFDAVLPPITVPQRTGYTFMGYYDVPNGHKASLAVQYYGTDGTAFQKKTWTKAGDGVLYAAWEPNSYTVTFDWNFTYNAAAYQPESNWTGTTKKVVFDTVYGTLPEPKRFGYTFQGWYETESGNNGTGTQVTKTTVLKRAENHTLYARWKVNTYTVNLDQRGALINGQTSFTIVFDTTLSDLTGAMPQKRGYTFHGYYSGKHGSGVQYFDAEGKAVLYAPAENPSRTFNGANFVTVLYAYWTQDEVVLPEAGDKTEPDDEDWITKEEEAIKEEVTRVPASILLYADDYNAQTDANSDRQPYFVQEAIPSTEQVALRARMDAWLLSYKVLRHAGKEYVPYTVTVSYRTQHEIEEEELVVSDVQTRSKTYLVPKTWAYYALESFGLYKPVSVSVSNDAFAYEVSVPVTEDSLCAYPVVQHTVYGEEENHISFTEGTHTKTVDGVGEITYTSGTNADGPYVSVVIPEQYLISDVLGSLPEVEKILDTISENAAWEDTSVYTAWSDRLTWDGVTVLDDIRQDVSGAGYLFGVLPESGDTAPNTWYRQAYVSGIPLKEKTANGTYASTALIRYAGDSHNLGVAPELVLESSVGDAVKVNDLVIHTPVACDGVIRAIGAEDGTMKPSDTAELVLQEDLNFFRVKVSNYGTHRLTLGYGEKDFLRALSGKTHVAEVGGTIYNQVRFPFDVFVDIRADSKDPVTGEINTTGDYFIKAGTWLTVGETEAVLYVPVTQEEGTYTVTFRSIAANCPVAEDGTFLIKEGNGGNVAYGTNIDSTKYVAYDTAELVIRGCIKDFELTKTSQESAQEQLENGKQLLALKKGSWFDFRFTTQGSFVQAGTKVTITPSYSWISADGRERVGAKLYYTEPINGKLMYYVQAGSETDAKNVHVVTNHDYTLAIPKTLLTKTATLLSESAFVGGIGERHTFGQITLNRYARMFRGIDTTTLPVRYCRTCHTAYREGEVSLCTHPLQSTGIKERAPVIRQEWYGQFYIPSYAYVIAEGTKEGYCSVCQKTVYVSGRKTKCADCQTELLGLTAFDFAAYASMQTLTGEEGFFKKDGYLAVSFTLTVLNDAGEEIPYTGFRDTEIARQWKESGLWYEEGDVILYEIARKVGDDYEVGGVE